MALAAAAAAIRRAEAIYITAGAGIGVCSGLPDFRGRQGLWREAQQHKQTIEQERQHHEEGLRVRASLPRPAARSSVLVPHARLVCTRPADSP